MDELPAAPPPIDPAEDKRRKLKRRIGFVALVAFVAFGFLFFGQKVPREVQLRFELPPTVRSPFVEIPRARVALVTAAVLDLDGARLATLNLPIPSGLVGPRTGPVVLRLKPGTYVVRAKIESFEATSVAMDGRFEVDGEEAIVELR